MPKLSSFFPFFSWGHKEGNPSLFIFVNMKIFEILGNFFVGSDGHLTDQEKFAYLPVAALILWIEDWDQMPRNA